MIPREIVHTKVDEDEGQVLVIKRVLCKECRQQFYAVRTFLEPEGVYNCYRRDELKERTGVRIRNPVFRSGCR